MLSLILLVFAFVLFTLAGLSWSVSQPRFNFLGLGLALVTLAEILARVPILSK